MYETIPAFAPVIIVLDSFFYTLKVCVCSVNLSLSPLPMHIKCFSLFLWSYVLFGKKWIECIWVN